MIFKYCKFPIRRTNNGISYLILPVFPYRKGPPPLPPRMSKPMISVTAQSSTESTQDAYFQSTGQPALGRPKQHSNSVDLIESSGRTSRGGYYSAGGSARLRQNSNSAESMDGRALRDSGYPAGSGPLRPKHSSSADSLLEGPRGPRERGGGSLGKSASLPQNSMTLSKTGQSIEELRQDGKGHKWRPSIAVQVRKHFCYLKTHLSYFSSVTVL